MEVMFDSQCGIKVFLLGASKESREGEVGALTAIPYFSFVLSHGGKSCCLIYTLFAFLLITETRHHKRKNKGIGVLYSYDIYC